MRKALAANLDTEQTTDGLLKWLCLHLPEEALPKQFAAKGKTLDVVSNRAKGKPGFAFQLGGGGGGAASGWSRGCRHWPSCCSLVLPKALKVEWPWSTLF